VAWETGVLMGMLDAGCDVVTGVDLVVGTSAGSTVGAQILSGESLEASYARQIDDNHSEISPQIDTELLALIFGELAAGGTTTDEQRIRIGTLALQTPTVSEKIRRDVIEKRLPCHEWPTTPLVLTAIDARTGELVTWDAKSGIALIDAVASSCAVPSVWPCVSINGKKYYDGGLRNAANAFLASGHSEVIVIAPQTTGLSPLIEEELRELRAAGSVVHFITCDADAIDAMGPNSLDPRFRRPAAEHGRRQGRTFHL
jgi:NTE family protein